MGYIHPGPALPPWAMFPSPSLPRKTALAIWARALEEWQTEATRLAQGGAPDSHRAAALKMSLDTARYRLGLVSA